MKKITLLIYILFSIIIFAEKGMYSDKIYFSSKMSSDIAVKDVAEGFSDIYMTSVPASLYEGLSKETRDKLDVYSVPSGSWSLVLNPKPNKAPYQNQYEGKTEFNPFAIKDFRYAMNFLINRKYIVDEIQNGQGGYTFTPATPGQPNAWRLELVANRLGFTAEGNEEMALKSMQNALVAAALESENKDRLVFRDNLWYFDNEAVTIRFIIRVDDPEGRMKLGKYVSDLLEKLGIKVEKLHWDRIKAVQSVYYDDPAKMNWHMYTESWLAGSTYINWAVPVLYHLSPIYNGMPGWGQEDWWNYENEEIEKISSDIRNKSILEMDEHWDRISKLTKLGLNDAVRIFLTYQNSYYIANKNRLLERMPYGLGHGLGRLSLENAKTKDKTLKVVQLSAAGGLFASPWDPIGSTGFSDTYSVTVVTTVFDREIVETPFGTFEQRRAKILENESKPYKDENGEIKGRLEVDSDATIYDPKTHKYKEIGTGHYAITKTKYKIDFGKWHHGRKIDVNDYIYADAFVYEWTYKIDENDKTFDSQYSAYFKDGIEKNATGWKINPDNTFTIWSKTYFPPVNETDAGAGAPGLSVISSSRPGYAVPWEILEAISLLITDGSKSKTVYGLAQKDGIDPIDLKNPKFVKDLKEKLLEMIEKKHIPIMLTGKVSIEKAISNYQLAIKWINEKGHGLIGYGPYFLNKINIGTGSVELLAFRDKDYPFEAKDFEKIYKKEMVKIDYLDYEELISAGDNLEIELALSLVQFPETKSIKTTKATCKLLFLIGDDLHEFKSSIIEGKIKFLIPSEFTENLEEGDYTFITMATLDGLFTDTSTGTVSVF